MDDIYILSDLNDVSETVNEPLKQSQRIRYTSFDISENFLILGASSGSLYVFKRKPYRFIHLVPNKHGTVRILSISPKEKYVAFATQKSTICVYVINSSQNYIPQITSTNVGDATITCLYWSDDEKQFYYGTKNGEVNLVTFSIFMGRSLLKLSIHPILFLESPIIQICDFESLLLVSNYTKCILCNTEYEEFKQIGNKPRDGSYGCCFLISPNENLYPSRIYCARPGSRLWEVDLEGNVLQTHQFKNALTCQPTKIVHSYKDISNSQKNNTNEYLPQNLQFSKLQKILNNFILTFTDSAIYVLDPQISDVILWCNEIERILDCKVLGNEIIVFTKGGSIITVHLQTIHSYAIDLISKQNLNDCVSLLKSHLKYFSEKTKEHYELSILMDIKLYLIKNNHYEALNDLSVIFDQITQEQYEITKRDLSTANIENGVYVLENSFCDNTKHKYNSDKPLKDSLLTVSGKFGKNIIKYKFNIFNDEQKSLVDDLIPTERKIPFNEISEQFKYEYDLICDPISHKEITNNELLIKRSTITDDDKCVQNLYLIYKSSKISKINFLDRYSHIFDRYDSRKIIDLLHKLENAMIENGESQQLAKYNCFEMYFNYFKPELIWEIDDYSRDFIINGFILINSYELIRCDSCDFPLHSNDTCFFPNLGEALIKFLWSRNNQEICFKIIKNVPFLMNTICRFYLQENQLNKILKMVFNYGDLKLLEEATNIFDLNTWDKFIELLVSSLNGKFNCFNCDKLIEHYIDNDYPFTWNSVLAIALKKLKSDQILDIIIKYSDFIPNSAIDRDFYLSCLVK